MKLREILNGINYQIIGNEELEIERISENTIADCANSVFVAIKGFNADGHDFIGEAINKGAKAIVVEKDVSEEIKNNVTVIRVDNTRKALAKMSINIYHDPAKELKIIGVTGTKGKTTTTYMIKSILEQHGYKVGLIGTIEKMIGDRKIGDSARTTPRKLRTSMRIKTNG